MTNVYARNEPVARQDVLILTRLRLALARYRHMVSRNTSCSVMVQPHAPGTISAGTKGQQAAGSLFKKNHPPALVGFTDLTYDRTGIRIPLKRKRILQKTRRGLLQRQKETA